MRYAILLFLLAATIPSSGQAPARAAIFQEGTISTNLSERDMAISPDGSEMYYTMQSGMGVFSTILVRKKMADGSWSAAEVAPFSGMFGDLEPAFSYDGSQLFFCSNRPLTAAAAAGKKDYDIWVLDRKGAGWSAPRNLGQNVNTAADEFYPSAGKSGNLYFTAEYKDKGVGKEDIYVSRWVNGAYSAAVPLDTMVNSKMYEFNAFVSSDEMFIIFTSYGRKDDAGGGDLYISEKNSSGAWTKARNLVQLNSPRLDYCPFVSPDQKTLYFTSNRHSLQSSYPQAVTFAQLKNFYQGVLNGTDNIYWVTFEGIRSGK
jgi:hypothetical protein